MLKIVQRTLLKGMDVHQSIYERTDGRLGSSPWGRPMLLLRTTGRRTGLLRTTALLYIRDEDQYAVVASNGGARRNPGWFHNLNATPDAEIQIGRTRIPVRSHIATEELRTLVFAKANKYMWGLYKNYQSRTDRRFPVVIFTPR